MSKRMTPGHIAEMNWPDRRTADMAANVLARLKTAGSALVAFSAGADSALLVVLAQAALNENILAVTAVSPLLSDDDRRAAAQLAAEYGFSHLFIETREMRDPAFLANTPERCYHCKTVLFDELRRLAAARSLAHVMDGSNVDDARDFRPGRRAAREYGVESPLADAGLTKSDIRRISNMLGLSTADKPAAACLASRIPYGTPITSEALRRVGQAEGFLRRLGFRQVRVRSHGGVACIELEPADIPRAADAAMRERIEQGVRDAGYRYVTLDLRGYRTGSLNEVLWKHDNGQSFNS